VLAEAETDELEGELVETVFEEAVFAFAVGAGCALAIVCVITVVVVVLDPATHLPLTKIKPNLFEQLLHPTPPSL